MPPTTRRSHSDSRPAKLDREVLALDVTVLAHALAKGRDQLRTPLGEGIVS